MMVETADEMADETARGPGAGTVPRATFEDLANAEEPMTPRPTTDDLARARFEKLAATGSIEAGLEILDRLDAFHGSVEREPPSPAVPPTPD